MTTTDLSGRTALVTGASRGIGLATAQTLAAAGANVVLTARTAQAAEDAAAQVGKQALGIEAHAVDEAAAEGCVQHTIEQFGSLDILVNNVGTNPAYGPVTKQDHARFSKSFDVNVWAPILWTSLAIRDWMSSHGGSVINTASIGGMSVEPNLGIYNAAKSALIHLTRQLAYENAPNVRVNAVAPGVVRTKLAEALWRDHETELNAALPLGRIGEPGDVGSAIGFLASDAASWVTGETFVIDGGALLGTNER